MTTPLAYLNPLLYILRHNTSPEVEVFDEMKISTDGIDIHSLTFQGTFEEGGDHEKVVRVKKEVTLNVWDFAGQGIVVAYLILPYFSANTQYRNILYYSSVLLE